MLSIGQCYIDFVNKILKEGKETYKDSDHHLKESLGNYYYIDDPLDLKFRAKYQHMTPELMLEEIKSGKFDIPSCPIKGDALYEYVKSFEIRDDQGFVYTYPNRIFNMTERHSDFMVDQFELMISRLSKKLGGSPGSNRAVANIYSAPKDCGMSDIPCLQILQATIRNHELILHCYFRSNDLYGAFPSNMLFLNYFGLKLVDELKKEYPLLKFKGISYNSSSLHVYQRDLEQAKKVIGVE